MARHLMKLYGKLRINKSGSWKKTYLAAPALSLYLKGSLALIHLRLYKNKIKPFG